MKHKVFLMMLLAALYFIEGCASNSSDSGATNKLENTQVQTLETVAVKRGEITPTLSVKSTVSKAAPFSLLTFEKGEFSTWVKNGYKVKAGEIIGYNNGRELISPVSATVVSKVADGTYPAYYPVITLEYVGFSFQFYGTNFIKSLPLDYSLASRYQIRDGIGPHDIAAVVMNGSQVEASKADSDRPAVESATSQSQEIMLQALIDINDAVREGQEATLVLSAEVKKDVLILPISTVAGRFKEGSVMVVVGDTTQVVDVGLGSSDGMYIEITSGLKEGDLVSTIPPNLDLRHP